MRIQLEGDFQTLIPLSSVVFLPYKLLPVNNLAFVVSQGTLY